jgi:TM2 domain-containing membrane protein YozV
MSDSGDYTLRWRGRESGPFAREEIDRQLDEHEIGMGHEIFYRDAWITLEEFYAGQQGRNAPPPSVAPHDAPPPHRATDTVKAAPAPPRAALPSHATAPRHRWLFALMAVLVGFTGAHNFYARQWLTGVLQLLLTVATYLMGFGILASWVWAVVEAIVVQKDGNGIEMI